MKRRCRILTTLSLFLALALPVGAHPLGNFSINQLARIRLTSSTVQVVYIVDFAEIPTFQMFAGKSTGDEVSRLSKEWASNLRMTEGEDPVALRVMGVEAEESPGDGGQMTVRAVLELEAPWNGNPATLSFRNGNYVDRIGWKDVLVESDNSISFPDGNPYTTDLTRALTAFPSDPLREIPSRQKITIRVASNEGRKPPSRAVLFGVGLALILGIIYRQRVSRAK